MKEELKQAIESKYNYHLERYGAEQALQDIELLRHADPEIMKQAGWVKSEDIMKLFEEYQSHEGCGCCGDYVQSKLIENAMRELTNLPKQ